jgi:predicted kinase
MLSAHQGCPFLRIDTIEQTIRNLCAIKVEGEGCRMAYRIASNHLSIGNSVVAGSCNPIALTRLAWHDVASKAGARAVNVEVICSGPVEHQKRVETRSAEVTGLALPTWQEVMNREHHPWNSDRIVIDTAGSNAAQSFAELQHKLSQQHIQQAVQASGHDLFYSHGVTHRAMPAPFGLNWVLVRSQRVIWFSYR